MYIMKKMLRLLAKDEITRSVSTAGIKIIISLPLVLLMSYGAEHTQYWAPVRLSAQLIEIGLGGVKNIEVFPSL